MKLESKADILICEIFLAICRLKDLPTKKENNKDREKEIDYIYAQTNEYLFQIAKKKAKGVYKKYERLKRIVNNNER